MKKYEILDAKNMIEFGSIYQALNDCFGTDYSGWMKATWPSNSGNGNFRVWFPKLSSFKDGKMVSAAYDCINTISKDWNEVVFDDLKKRQPSDDVQYKGIDLIFAREPNNGPIIFRGVYERNIEKSYANHEVSKRIATKVRIIGDPAYDIEVLDRIDSGDDRISINVPMNPVQVDLDNGKALITCGRCGYKYHEAPRCPECGQLVNLEGIHE